MAHKQWNSEKTITVVKYLSSGTCQYFTLFCTVLLVAAVVSGNAIHSLRFLMLLPMAFCLSAARALYRLTPWSALVRHVLHFMVCMVGVLLFELPRKVYNDGTNTLMLLLCATIVYGLFLATFLIVKRVRNRKKPADTAYQSQFSDFQK